MNPINRCLLFTTQALALAHLKTTAQDNSMTANFTDDTTPLHNLHNAVRGRYESN
ncbi:MAG: hypothetical protein ACJAWL_001414 [Motiliproteus sp.]|jgi:hypothetical protein